jgi:hypothetical protein
VVSVSAALLLSGCSSSGTVGSSAGSKTGGTTGGTAASGGSSSTSGGAAAAVGGLGGSDPGCQAALKAANDATSAMGNMKDPAGAATAFNNLASQMHSAAKLAQKPGAADAINKLADDYAKIASSMSGGSTPDFSGMGTDAAAMGTACA